MSSSVHIGFSASKEFLADLDLLVTDHRRAHPDRNCSRSSFIKELCAQAIADRAGVANANYQSAPMRTRVRPSA